MSDRWQATKFDYQTEWPIRMAAVRHRGAWTHVIVCLSHLAADGAGVGVMMRELAERDRATNRARTPVASMSPLELSARQAEPGTRRLSEVSLRYWEQTLRQVAPERFAAPPVADRPEPRYRQLTYRSEALRMAARVVGDRLGGPFTPVILGAYAVMLRRISGVDPVVIQGIVANRFRPGLTEATHPLCQNGILVIGVGDATLDEVVDRAQRASLRASKNAYFDPDDHAAMLARVDRERGAHVDIACLFNARDQSGGPLDPDPLPTAAEIDAARDHSVLTWGPPMPVFPEKAMLNFEDSFGAAELLLEADTTTCRRSRWSRCCGAWRKSSSRRPIRRASSRGGCPGSSGACQACAERRPPYDAISASTTVSASAAARSSGYSGSRSSQTTSHDP